MRKQKMEMELEFHFPMPSKNSWHYKGTRILVTFYLSMSNFCLLCSWLTVKFLSFGYSCNIQGFWYFARSQSCKIQVNPQNPTKFTNTHSKCHKIWQKSYRIHTCFYNIFETYVSYWGYLLALNLQIYLETLSLKSANNIPKLRPVSNVVLLLC